MIPLARTQVYSGNRNEDIHISNFKVAILSCVFLSLVTMACMSSFFVTVSLLCECCLLIFIITFEFEQMIYRCILFGDTMQAGLTAKLGFDCK